MDATTFAIVGGGSRSEVYVRAARAWPHLFDLLGIAARKPQRQHELQSLFNVPCVDTLQNLLTLGPLSFVVVATPRAVTPAILRQLASVGVPVLCETPPAASEDELDALWRDCALARIQIAEQYPFLSSNAARLKLIADGYLGAPSYAHVSLGHGYHGLACARKALGTGFGQPVVIGRRLLSKAAGSRTDGDRSVVLPVTSSTQHVVIYDYGDAVMLYDFCEHQYTSSIRARRLFVRGERGELDGSRVRFLDDEGNATTLHMKRLNEKGEQVGDDDTAQEIRLGDEVVYESPLPSAGTTDDEIAVGTCLMKMGDYVRTGCSFYSLAEACQDTYLELLAWQAISTGTVTRAVAQPWMP